MWEIDVRVVSMLGMPVRIFQRIMIVWVFVSKRSSTFKFAASNQQGHKPRHPKDIQTNSHSSLASRVRNNSKILENGESVDV